MKKLILILIIVKVLLNNDHLLYIFWNNPNEISLCQTLTECPKLRLEYQIRPNIIKSKKKNSLINQPYPFIQFSIFSKNDIIEIFFPKSVKTKKIEYGVSNSFYFSYASESKNLQLIFKERDHHKEVNYQLTIEEIRKPSEPIQKKKKNQSKFTSRAISKNSGQEYSGDQQIINKEPIVEAQNNNIADEKFEDNAIIDNIKPQKTPDENFTDLTRNLTNQKPNIRIII